MSACLFLSMVDFCQIVKSAQKKKLSNCILKKKNLTKIDKFFFPRGYLKFDRNRQKKIFRAVVKFDRNRQKNNFPRGSKFWQKTRKLGWVWVGFWFGLSLGWVWVGFESLCRGPSGFWVTIQRHLRVLSHQTHSHLPNKK